MRKALHGWRPKLEIEAMGIFWDRHGYVLEEKNGILEMSESGKD